MATTHTNQKTPPQTVLKTFFSRSRIGHVAWLCSFVWFCTCQVSDHGKSRPLWPQKKIFSNWSGVVFRGLFGLTHTSTTDLKHFWLVLDPFWALQDPPPKVALWGWPTPKAHMAQIWPSIWGSWTPILGEKKYFLKVVWGDFFSLCGLSTPIKSDIYQLWWILTPICPIWTPQTIFGGWVRKC